MRTDRAHQMTVSLHLADCLHQLAAMPDACVDAVVTDPPYGLAFMGKDWDSFKATNEAKSQVVKGLGTGMRMTTLAENRNFQEWNLQWATECLRVLKPGGWLLAFSGSRTYHRLACAVEEAGFEVRDQMLWIYSTGFPKSMNVGKAIDKAAGAEREVVGQQRGNANRKGYKTDGKTQSGGAFAEGEFNVTAPATPEAAQWAGWGTALKPAHEPIVMARKPLIGTVAANVLEHGTGALNIDGCRVGSEERTYALTMTAGNFEATGGGLNRKSGESTVQGRWPANVIHDGSDEVVALFPQTGISRGGNSQQINSGTGRYNWNTGTDKATPDGVDPGYGDSGSAARFFYCAKPSKTEKDHGCDDLPISRPDDRTETGMGSFADKGVLPGRNSHPTVKPVALMRYLCRLVTPPGGIVLDPFMGSGSTGIAALQEDFNFIGIEREPEYLEIARRRITAAQAGVKQLPLLAV